MLVIRYTKILRGKMYHRLSLADHLAVACTGRTGLDPILTLEGRQLEEERRKTRGSLSEH